MACVIGFDVGTTSTVGILIRPPTTVLALEARPVDLASPHPGWAEEDPERWWANIVEITRRLLVTSGVNPGEIKGVGVSGMVPAVVLLDAQGRLLRPSIQQSDARCVREVAALRAEVEEEAFTQIAGNGINQQLVACKLRWIECHEPDVFGRIATVFGSYDYINFRLTEAKRIEQNWALEAGLVDLRTHAISPDLAAYSHLPRSSFPDKAASAEIIGHVTETAASQTGLASGTPVVGGAADFIASALAAGLSQPGDVLLKFGGSIDVVAVSSVAAPDRRMFLDYHLIPGLFVPNGCMSTGGSALNWFVSQFAQGETAAAETAGLSLHQHLDRLARAIPPGADGVAVLPYFLGEKTPIHDALARGTISGLSLNHGVAHIWRALLEAYAYAIAHHLEVFSDMGMKASRLFASDGGAASEVWMQIVSDVLQKPVQLLTGHPGSCLGAAWTAAIGVDLTIDWNGAAGFVELGELISPDPKRAEVYGQGYQAYRDRYRRLKHPPA